MEKTSPLLKSKFFWIGILYFAEGFPLGVFYDVFPVHFRQQGVDLWQIGFMSLLGLSWTIKFLWAPAVDFYRHHRRWIFVMDLLMGGVLLLFALWLDFGPWVWVAIGLFTLFSATSDIAIDAYTIEMLDKNELGMANGLRNGFYRVGMLGAGFILILSDMLGWAATYIAGAGILAVCGVACLFAPNEIQVTERPRISMRDEWVNLLRHPLAVLGVYLVFLGVIRLVDQKAGILGAHPYAWPFLVLTGGVLYGSAVIFQTSSARRKKEKNNSVLSEGPMFGALFELLQRPYIVPIIIFILIFKLADTSMGFMVKPFWVDAGFSASQIGLVSVQIGLGLSIAGGIVGGWYTDRVGIFKAVWVLGLWQALSNLGYAYVASVVPLAETGIPLSLDSKFLMYGASVLESFTGGLGSAAFLAFLMAIVNKRRSAAEYALLSSIFAFSRSVAGWASGFGAEAMGYAPYFFLTFFLAFPAYFFLPWVKKMLAYSDRGNNETG